MDAVQNFRFSRSLEEPLVGDHLDGRYVSPPESLPHIPFSERTAPRERARLCRCYIDLLSLFFSVVRGRVNILIGAINSNYDDSREEIRQIFG